VSTAEAMQAASPAIGIVVAVLLIHSWNRQPRRSRAQVQAEIEEYRRREVERERWYQWELESDSLGDMREVGRPIA